MPQTINEDLKEMFSYHETLALVCFNINYAKRFETVTIEKLSYLLGIEAGRLEKACRILKAAGMAKVTYLNGKKMIEMIDPEDSVVKNTVFDVMFEKRYEYSMIYKSIVQGELTYRQ